MNDLATVLISAVFVMAGVVTWMWGHHAGYRHGIEAERDATARRFHTFRLKRFNAEEQ